ncbi:dihydropteroate synthase [Chitinivorax sp. B]|uniref:dihydropteroate synthase n=1 Tax=Chitinivorax sp. B TaxID=2502235 RepID=UPI002016D06C|nr:dihydropteroate synthase [Chitinivorax sp. B]
MGILNITPDSFSDGGRYLDTSLAIARAKTMLDEGADIIDVGGESTRPNAPAVSENEEWKRLVSVLPQLVSLGIPVSIDTRKTTIMRLAVEHGVDMINDVGALEDAGAMDVAASSKVAVCLMHKKGNPDNMQHNPDYANVLDEVSTYLERRAHIALQAGVSRDRIVIDPGFGFGKTLDHNLDLLKKLRQLTLLGFPVLVGLSRKSMLGMLTGEIVENRIHASVAAALLAVQKGAAIVRVHDVKATKDALTILTAVEQ